MSFNNVLLDELWVGEKSICFFVNAGKCYWVADCKYNFSLDAEKDYLGYLNKGHITQDQYAQACKEFRGGILKLTSENFLKYISYVNEGSISVRDLEDIFYIGESYKDIELLRRVERYYLSGEALSPSDFILVGQIASRLPMFYINFDRKIYMHMDVGRCHEDLAYPDWYSKCADFGFLIPDGERYWMRSGDSWKLRFIQSS